jgi:alkanesulfonate monooxygenase SsuD/methylene tetrahydromethanopterin reductase-like flavin-dependent oxidoreductase (luciferase family)
MAGRTTRIDFGTMVIVLPWHDPVQVAEEIAMLDNLLEGRRLTLGLGRGAGRVEFEGMRVAMGESRGRFLEALEVLRRALGDETFSFEGEFYNVPPMSIRPRPRSGKALLDRMYCAWGSPETVPMAAKAGLAPLFIPQKSWEEIADEVALFNSVRAEQGWEPQQPTVVCWVYCAETDDEAWDVAREYMGNYVNSAYRHYEIFDPEHFEKAGNYQFYADMARKRAQVSDDVAVDAFSSVQVWGTPERCIEALRNIQRTTGANEFVGVFNYGDLPVDLAEKSMRLFAEKVLPVMQLEEAAPVFR